MLAGLRFILTRHLTGHDDTLIELFSSTRSGQYADQIIQTCVDALFATMQQKDRLAGVFADIGSYPRPHANARHCATGIRRLGTVGYETLIERILAEPDGMRRYKRARLLARASRHRMPEDGDFWKNADQAAIREVVDAWRTQLRKSGRLDDTPADLAATTNGVAANDLSTGDQ